ncbi:hypothetical protein GDO86_001762 [Hymenochirus boettgeri]|uniref:Uncharacterized protein n=1 Tax=Hymenochirus boettgeri TaxID=247094 RepID=A0A8T2KMC5_9PIPI|nr:hypothetical protein GDO86_001762 [Hymenochirus boettgeri]
MHKIQIKSQLHSINLNVIKIKKSWLNFFGFRKKNVIAHLFKSQDKNKIRWKLHEMKKLLQKASEVANIFRKQHYAVVLMYSSPILIFIYNPLCRLNKITT